MKNEYYHELADVAEELKRREKLRCVIDKYFSQLGFGYPPLPTSIQNMAIMARHIATFRYEDAAFTILARRAGLHPVWLEYTGDKMVSCSRVKMSLLTPFFCNGRGRNMGLRLRKERLAHIDMWNGEKIWKIQTKQGMSLLSYHHAHLERMMPGATRADITEWLEQIGNAKNYYSIYLTIFIAHGVLFEDYHGGESGNRLDRFTIDVFEPAWQSVVQRFGIKPLIVRLPWYDGFQYYPESRNWAEHGVIPDSI